MCGHAQTGPNLHVSHKLVMKIHSLILYLNHISFSSARILSGIDTSGSLGSETNDEEMNVLLYGIAFPVGSCLLAMILSEAR